MAFNTVADLVFRVGRHESAVVIPNSPVVEIL